MNNIKIEHCMLAARICAGLLVVFFFLPWASVTISFMGITESENINGWSFAFGDDGRFLIITVLLAPLALLALTFLKTSFPNEKQYYLILACVAAAGLLFMIITHFSINDDVALLRIFGARSGFTAFYTLGFIIHVVLACICGFTFWKFGLRGNVPGVGGNIGSQSPPASGNVKFCPNCGATPEGSTRFCNNCGHDLTS
jgi:hypothetical protein